MKSSFSQVWLQRATQLDVLVVTEILNRHFMNVMRESSIKTQSFVTSISSCPDFVMLQSISHSFVIINTCTHFQNRLKQHVQEGPRQGPYRACLKFSEDEQVMKDRFPGPTNVDISRILRQAFPAVVTKRSSFVIGVRRCSSSALSPFSQSSLVSPPSLSQTITHPLQLENARLLARVHQLEQHLKSLTQGDSIHPSTLEEEVLQLTSSPVFVHGLDNLEGFEKFPLDVVLSEVNTLAPTCSPFLTD